jgi:hypothetical protein
MAGRVSRIAPYGSLLKGAVPTKARKTEKPGARKTDGEHLEAVRQCSCLACGADPAGEAAHVRMTAPGKTSPGMGRRPDDEHTVPLCHACHMRQHEIGEVKFWADVGVDPLKVAAALYRMSPRTEAMRAAVFAAQAIGGQK